MTQILENRVAIVTGGRRGIGRAAARKFAKEGGCGRADPAHLFCGLALEVSLSDTAQSPGGAIVLRPPNFEFVIREGA